MRALAWLPLVLAVGCDDPNATVVVENVSLGKTDTGHIAVDIEVVGAQAGGGDVGSYCVSAHWFPLFADLSLTPTDNVYPGELDHVVVCENGGLSDGDHRTFHFESTKTDRDLVVNTPVRGQARVGRSYHKQDTSNP
jgi:hypothetical protein